jgi:hypothetical protein
MFEYDAVLGWRNKPGKYLVPRFAPQGDDTTVMILADGSRATSSVSDSQSPIDRLLIVGGSFTQGWALSDHETYPWKLQQRYPSLHVINYGTAAYGTYQSLRLLERYFAESEPPRIVIYGFIEHHETRNVAALAWLRLNARLAKSRSASIPYAGMNDDGAITRPPPDSYSVWPFAESSAFIALLQEGYARFKTAGRGAKARPVTVELIRQMDQLCGEHGTRFIAVLLAAYPRTRSHYANVLSELEIKVSDCVRREGLRDLFVPGALHPNGEANSLWAECIASAIDER